MEAAGLAADQKKARRLNAALVFLDETGFLTRPYVGRTWSPGGERPVITRRVRHREGVTVLGSLTLSPLRRRRGLYCRFLRGRSVTQEDLVAHLRDLRRRLAAPLAVVLDNLGTHKGKRLRAWCEKVGDVFLEFLPPYAPELNPVEGAWGHGKRTTAAGRRVDTAEELEALARESMSAGDREGLLRGFIKGTRLPLRFDLPQRIGSCQRE